MQQELNDLYNSKITSAFRCITGCLQNGHQEEVTHPLLLCVHDEYEHAGLKIMFFGQETNNWYGKWETTNVNNLLKYYHDFYCTGECYSYGKHFWNGMRKFRERIGEVDGPIPGLLWNNIVKIGKCAAKGSPSKVIIDAQSSTFDVVSAEVGITKPNIVLFFTGPNYDHIIRRTFPDVKFLSVCEWTERALARLASRSLPERSFRTYHPNYLWRKGFYTYLNAIVNEIRILGA